MTTSPIKLPKSAPAMADRLYKLKELIKESKAKTEVLEDERKAIEGYLISNLPSDGGTGVQGKVARVSLIVNEVPQVEDWDKLRKYIVKTGSWELLQKRVNSAPCAERWEAGEKIPGVTAFPKVTISLNKV